MPGEYGIPPGDLMELDRALAVVVTHDKAGAPWLIGSESAVLDRAKRTVRYYAERTFRKEMRTEEAAPTAGEPMTDPFQRQRS